MSFCSPKVMFTGSFEWTTITPSADSRIVYVSSSEGSDGNSGLSESMPVKTIAKARSLFTLGQPAWLLLKRGDTFPEPIGQWLWSGTSADAPSVVSYYGTNGDRPIIDQDTTDGINISTHNPPLSNICIVGIDFYDSKRDPNSTNFVGPSINGGGIHYSSTGENLLIEDCVVRYYQQNVIVDGQRGSAGLKNLTIRRSIIMNAYGTVGRPQGLVSGNVDGALIEENIFDHNGWNTQVPGADPNTENHNVYLATDPETFYKNIIFRHNISANASATGFQSRVGATTQNNLFISNPLSVTIANSSGSVTGNVFLHGNDIQSTPLAPRAMGVWCGSGWPDVASNSPPVSIEDNVFAHDVGMYGGYAVNLYAGTSGARVQNNIIYQWRGGIIDSGTDDIIGNNIIDGTGYPDPGRSIGTYNVTLGGTGTTAAFLATAEARPVGVWPRRYTAKAVIEYIREGFGLTTGEPYFTLIKKK